MPRHTETGRELNSQKNRDKQKVTHTHTHTD